VQDFVQNLLRGISTLFARMYEGSPALWGSKYWVFLLEVILLIIVVDLIIFGWRPLVKKFLPHAYSTVDYVFGQVVNILAFIVLVVFLFYLGAQLGAAWGTFLGFSTMIWATVGIIALILLGRLLMGRK